MATRRHASKPCSNCVGLAASSVRTTAMTKAATQQPQIASVLSVSPTDVGHRRHHLRIQQTASDNLVPGDLPSDPDQKIVSAIQLHRQLGISYDETWRMKHKQMQVMLKRGEKQRLSGLVQMSDDYLGASKATSADSGPVVRHPLCPPCSAISR